MKLIDKLYNWAFNIKPEKKKLTPPKGGTGETSRRFTDVITGEYERRRVDITTGEYEFQRIHADKIDCSSIDAGYPFDPIYKTLTDPVDEWFRKHPEAKSVNLGGCTQNRITRTSPPPKPPGDIPIRYLAGHTLPKLPEPPPNRIVYK